MTALPSRLQGRRRASTAVSATASLAVLGSMLAAVPPAAAFAPDSAVFINELHYDNTGTDVNEFVEVAGPAGTDLTDWSIVLYNGNGGGSYGTLALAGTLADDTGTGFGFIDVVGPAAGIQNGAPDGVALVDAGGQVVQFLSYEGVFTAVGGPADGRTSTDIGVAETGNEAAGLSLQLAGTGDSYGDFTWQPPAAETPGATNNDQLFLASGDPVPPTVSCATGVEATTGEGATSPVSASDPDSLINSLSITSEPVEGITLQDVTLPTEEGGTATGTLTIAPATAVGTYQVQITATTDDGAQALCTVAVTVSDPLEPTLVSAVQGAGAASPMVGQDVQVEAVATSLITRFDALNGFFVQEEDEDADSDPATSEGVYVFCGAVCPTDLEAGDLVTVEGEVQEFNLTTQINATNGSIAVGEQVGLPTPAAITLPAGASTRDSATFEAVEGMLTTVETTLAVSEYFNLARYGEIVLTAQEREYQFTQTSTPSVGGYEAFLADLATRRIVLDDDSNDENDATSGPQANEPYYYPTPGLSTENYFRGGDTITGLTGAMEWAFGAWKLRPVPGEDYTFEPANPRPASPEEVGGRLTVASFNVLNYFATIDETSSNDTGPCGPSGTMDCRGADSEQERQRQLAKIVAALTEIDADVFGLIEIENDEGLATQQIVEALNTATGGAYAYVDTGYIGTDAIKQAFVYDASTVSPVGEFDLLTEADDPRFDDDRNRPALIQTFEEIATGEVFTVAVNHLKSKGSGCGAGDDSPQDGSGNCDGTRTQAAQALADYLATDPTGSGDPDYLVIGDLNSYAMERPITTLEAAGYVDLLKAYQGLESYGYLFDGLLGHLDHALATESLAEQVTGAGGWKINADEVPLFDYNDDIRDLGEAAFERESSALPLYEPDPYRSSDHDPVIVGLELGDAVATDIVHRIAGKDRYATAAQIALEFSEVDTVYIATGSQFADALAGAAPAAAGLVPGGGVAPDGSAAPVLLTRVGSLPSATQAALELLDPSNIVILGGEVAVSEAVEAELEAYGAVTRVAGKDRYHTAALLAAEYGQVDHVYVATGEGENFADALSGGALAGSEGAPVLLVRSDGVPGAVTQALAQLGDPEVTILGGEAAVSEDVAEELGATDRIAGANRYLTSVAVAERFGYSEENPADAVYVATGEQFPDALAGSALAGSQDVPVMLSRQDSVPSGVLSAMVEINPAAVYILGGEVALSEAVEAQLEETFNTGAGGTGYHRR